MSSRYAVRQVLDQELHKFRVLQAASARQARFAAGGPTSQDPGADKENIPAKGGRRSEAMVDQASGRVKRDFFGRVIANEEDRGDGSGGKGAGTATTKPGNKGRTWVTYHEGFSNAVRKPISLKELMNGF